MWESAKAFVRGPVWKLAGAISGLTTIVGIARAIDGDEFWMWLFFAALALVVASFLSFHRSRSEDERKRESLPSKIDDLHRIGLDLLGELSVRPEPEEVAPGQWSIAFGEAPSEWWEKAAGFDQTIRDLFVEHYPALLSDYALGANEYVREKRETQEEKDAALKADPKLDRRSDSERMRDFAFETQSGPARRVEAALQGLAVARYRVGS